MKEKIWIIAAYFGKPPELFATWLESCGRNDFINFLLIVDFQVCDFDIPPNVTTQKFSFIELKEILEFNLGMEISLAHPYKLCDFRVAYWVILEHLQISYDYWGYCDLDLIFGDLRRFITKELLQGYDRILGVGHLSIIKRSPISCMSFMLRGAGHNWKGIFSSSSNYGFDEHHGWNEIWNSYDLSIYENESIVADIDPQFQSPFLCWLHYNHPRQCFCRIQGRTLQIYAMGSKIKSREFAYIHLQKRKIQVECDPSNDFILINDKLKALNVDDFSQYLKGFYSPTKDIFSSKFMISVVRFMKRIIMHSLIQWKNRLLLRHQ